jgi:hypothetical protein
MTTRLVHPALLAAGLMAAAVAAAAPNLGELWSVLHEQHISIDSNLVQTAAIEGALKAIDPHARILGQDEARPSDKGQTLVQSEDLGEGIAYLKLGGLFAGGGGDVLRALEPASNRVCTGVVLDLRGAGGANLEAADTIAGALGAGASAGYALKDGRGAPVSEHHPVHGAITWPGKPLMVLVDHKTREASEVLAAVMESCRGVMLLGTATAGDAGVRDVLRLPDGTSIYLRTRRAAVFGGAGYEGKGVEPDVTVEAVERPAAEAAARREERRGKLSAKALSDRKLIERVKQDAVLARAVDILLGLKALDAQASETTTNCTGAAGS